MSASVKLPPKLVEPRVGRQSHPAPLLMARPAPQMEGNWLIYKLPDWIHDDNVKNCLSCSLKFSVWNRRHHCRACGGIYCADCAKESWILPQFGLTSPERLCKHCVETQTTIFDLHTKLTTTKSNLAAHNQRYSRLKECAPVLQVGAMFSCFLDGSMKPRKLALSDDLLMIAIINTRTNKVTNAYEITQISLQPGAYDDAKEAIGSSSLCFTMACSDQIFTLQASNNDQFQYWLDGVHLAQEMVMHTQVVASFEHDIELTNIALDAAIQSQINFAVSKVFPNDNQEPSLLTLRDINEDEEGPSESDTDSFKLKRDSKRSSPSKYDQNSQNTEDDAPPAALKMGRSVPRPSGYLNRRSGVSESAETLSPLLENGSLTSEGRKIGLTSPKTLSPMISPSTSRPMSPIISSPSESFGEKSPVKPKTNTSITVFENSSPSSVDGDSIARKIAATKPYSSSYLGTFDSAPSTPQEGSLQSISTTEKTDPNQTEQQRKEEKQQEEKQQDQKQEQQNQQESLPQPLLLTAAQSASNCTADNEVSPFD